MGMSDVVLNTTEVDRLRREKGVSRKELSRRLGLSQSFGYEMQKRGTLPDDLPRRKKVVDALAHYFGVEVTQLLLRLEARQKLA